jgi:hypothetical protein
MVSIGLFVHGYKCTYIQVDIMNIDIIKVDTDEDC